MGGEAAAGPRGPGGGAPTRAGAPPPPPAGPPVVLRLRALSDRREPAPVVARLGRRRSEDLGRPRQLRRAVRRSGVLYRARQQSVLARALSRSTDARARARAVCQPGCARHPADPRAVLVSVRDQPGGGGPD